jgi:uncharacterized protein YdeI (YjbR/CyaY-like superfamily)
MDEKNSIKWTEELTLLAEIIQKAPLEKTIKWGAEVYTFQGKNVISYAGFKNYFALWFYNGVFLKDPNNVLMNAQKGKTKSLRQWRFTSINEIDEKVILDYIAEAIEVEEKGLKIKTEKFKAIPPPQLLLEKFDKVDNLKSAFENLSPGKKKEYIVYINEAKQLTTKKRRLEKIIPMILNGIGLNDKYR